MWPGDPDALPPQDQTAGQVQVLPAARGVEGDRHPLQPDGDDDAAAPPPSHSPPQDDAGTHPSYESVKI